MKKELNIENIIHYFKYDTRLDFNIIQFKHYNRPNYVGVKVIERIYFDLMHRFGENDTVVNSIWNSNDLYIGAPVNMMEDKKNKHLTLNRIDFTFFYPNIIVKLIDTGEMNISHPALVPIYKFLLHNSQELYDHKDTCDTMVKLIRCSINILYSFANSRMTTIKISNPDNVIEYYKGVYTKLSDIPGFVYNDVDSVFYYSESEESIIELVDTLDLPYTIEKDVFCYFIQKMKYFSIDGDGLKIRGMIDPRDPLRPSRRTGTISPSAVKRQNEMLRILNGFEILARNKKIEKIISNISG